MESFEHVISKFENIKSKYILKKIFNNISEKRALQIIKHNKKLQKRLGIELKDYKGISEIEIEIIPIKNETGKFINIDKKDDEFYHIYFNDNKIEIKKNKRNYLTEEDNVSKIKVIIDYQVTSLNELFRYCKCIKIINFIKFNRNNINNMKSMFSSCTSLEKLNISNFNTDNVTNMSGMFFELSSLKELNLSNLKTNKVTNMENMFSICNLLTELNLSYFNTDNVTDMSFYVLCMLFIKRIKHFQF